MNPKVSIVIPTYTRADKLKECLESIVQYTNMLQTEIVVVANGMPAHTEDVCANLRLPMEYLSSAPEPWLNMLEYGEPLGYPKAVNHGIRAARGEYIVLLNDDTQLLPQSINHWIDVMMKPMLEDGAVGVTGPLETFDENSRHNFLIFFCVMIRKKCFDEVGLLDEGFKYFGEDTAFCIEAEKKGWKVVRVPEDHPTELVPLDPNTTSLETWKHDKIHSGNFPIFHDAESTIGRLTDSEEVLRESRARLRELYGNPDDINIHRAMVTDGWIAHDELVWLARTAKSLGPNATIVQVGVWHGKSSRAISDNMCAGSKLFDCDTFNGSSGEPDQHATAKEREGDHCFQWYWDNQYEQILKGEVIPLRMHSHNAAHTLAHRGIKADMIFIDADHTYEGVRDDIQAWLPLLKEGGVICGHDFYKEGEDPFAWMGVRQAVREAFPNVEKSATSIWHVRPHEKQVERGNVYDCFLFHNELDVLEIRLATLYDVVDRFVLVEATHTHAGEPKPLHFDDNKERFAKYLNKIAHVVIDFPEFEGNVYDKAWARERYQRDACMKALGNCEDNDIIIIGDADEIASPEAVRDYKLSDGLVRLKQRMFYYYLNCENKEGWDWQKIAPYKLVKELTPCGIRYPPAGGVPLVEDAGWHFSMMGGAEAVRGKLKSYSHQEFNRPEILDGVDLAVMEGRDIFGRDLQYELVQIDESWPQHVNDHYLPLVSKGLIKDWKSNVVEFKRSQTVTACVSTKDRYQTTLPLCLSAIINQTRKPDKLKIYDDGEQANLFELAPFNGLLQLAKDKGIDVEVLSTPRKGQVLNHQHCLEAATTEIVWRVDDDEVPEADCLEKLLSEMKDGVGAVAGLVHHPNGVFPLPNDLSGSLADATRASIQWFDWNGGSREVEHLYSTFAYSVSAARQAGGYPMELSPVGHREESIFSHRIHRAGHKLLVTPHAKTLHLQQPTGGIRSYSDSSMWAHDEGVFQGYLKAWQLPIADTKLLVCDFGLGDHLILKAIWNDLVRKYPDRKWTLALCFPEVFKDIPNVQIISIAEAKYLLGFNYDNYSVYAHAMKHNLERPMPEVMLEFFGQ